MDFIDEPGPGRKLLRDRHYCWRINSRDDVWTKRRNRSLQFRLGPAHLDMLSEVIKQARTVAALKEQAACSNAPSDEVLEAAVQDYLHSAQRQELIDK